jgi:hypothetical protein
MGGEALAVKSKGVERPPNGKSFISRKLQNTTLELRRIGVKFPRGMDSGLVG